jgi:hypothetical protein
MIYQNQKVKMKMMSEQWRKWEPIPGLEGIYDLEKLCDDLTGYEIILVHSKDKNKKIRLVWKTSVHSCTRTDKIFASKIIASIDRKYGSEFHKNWSFFSLEDSDYLKRLYEESHTLSESFYGVIHFAIITSDSIIDIIPAYEPEVGWIL